MNTQDHKQALPPGFRLGSYRVVRVLGADGFGVTYLCEHGGLGVTVAVKEYLPNDIAVRSGSAVTPKSAADREGYAWGLSRFLGEARTLARFEHRNVVRVRDVVEANGTAYIVMDYEDGEPLDRVLGTEGSTKTGNCSLGDQANRTPPPMRRSRTAWLLGGVTVAVAAFICLAIIDGKLALREAGLKAGDRFRDCPECPEMVVVPRGRNWMGSPHYAEERQENEGPWHDVTIAAPFAIGVYEVTVAEFRRFVGETGYSAASSCYTHEGGESADRTDRSWWNSGFSQGERHPVVCVSWNDVQAYAVWLSRKTGEKYRLLSESEWEYAARAGTETARYWGQRGWAQCRYANGADRSLEERYSGWRGASCRDGHVHTAPVGSFGANGWGLHDVLGNVWEWTEDCWNDSYGNAPSDGSAWEYGDCEWRVLRGGSWLHGPLSLRAAHRESFSTSVGFYNIGFRVARTLAP